MVSQMLSYNVYKTLLLALYVDYRMALLLQECYVNYIGCLLSNELRIKSRPSHIVHVILVNLFICVIYSLTIDQQELYDHQTRTYSLYQTVLRQLLPLVLLASRRLLFGTTYLLLLKLLTLLMFLNAV